jgi:hypothetical protein
LAIARRLWLTLCGLAIFILNFFVCRELFHTEYTDRVITGDAAFISISRYMLDHWRDDSWWPVWYDGIPGHNAYPPLLHAIVALMAAVERISPALAHHQFGAIVYALAPLAVFFLCYRFSGSIATALGAGLAFTLLSPSTVLMPAARAGAGGWFGPWRLCVLVAYGDAPHMFGFALIPFAILALDSALTRRRPIYYFATALLLAAIVLTNWLASVGLACTVFVYLIATTGVWADLRRWGLAALISIAAYILACPWIPPSTIMLVRANGQVATEGDYRSDMRWLPARALVILILIVLLKFALQKWRAPAGIQFAALMMILPGGIPLLWSLTGMSLLPLPHRYVWELDLASTLLAALLFAALLKKFPRPAIYSAIALLLLFGCFQLRAYPRYAAALIKPIDMSTTVEFQIADWLKRHQPGARVFAIGSVAYWLNNFSDLQQITGGFEHATPNPANRDATSAITFEGASTSLLWLRALGADIAVVGGPKTRAPFRMIQDPAKFDAFAQKIWSDGDDFIYLIPRRSRSLAHVVRRQDLAAGEATLPRYVAALEDPSLPTAAFHWRDSHSALIDADVPAGDVLSVQINYHPGWHAAVNGSPRPIEKDALGLMAIDPACSGPCTVALTYDGGLEALVTRWAAAAMLIGFAGLCLIGFAWRGA